MATPNPEQIEAIKTVRGPVLLSSGAGSGKTSVLVNRIAGIVRSGTPARRVLAVTFSKRGADVMNQRIDRILGPDSGAQVGTFHGLAYQIIRSEDPAMRGFTVDGKDRYRICIKDATGHKKMKWIGADVTLVSSYIAECKANGFRPSTPGALKEAIRYGARVRAIPARFVTAYAESDAFAHERKLLTFDEMLIRAVELLQDEGIRKRWATRWDYIMQDEAQDQNKCQVTICELLAKDHRNYMIVGDVSQTIYSWRGAAPEHMLNFEKTWGAKVIHMARNYRSGNKIIMVANKVLRHMPPHTRLNMDLICEAGHEGEVEYHSYIDRDDEAYGVEEEIELHIEDKVQPKDIAVLYRLNDQSRAVEEQLIKKGIPYRVIGTVNFYERKEIKDLIAYLRLADGRGDVDDMSRCINAPFRFLGAEFVAKMRRNMRDSALHVSWSTRIADFCSKEQVQHRQVISATDWATLVDRLAEMIKANRRPERILGEVVLSTSYLDHLRKDEGEESPENSRISNVHELLSASTKFRTCAELLDYIEQVTQMSKQNHIDDVGNKVTLCTIFRAKGAEFPVVFLVGCSEGTLPHYRTTNLNEERRLFYVGVTRAKNYLAVSSVKNVALGTSIRRVEPSRFIIEAELDQ